MVITRVTWTSPCSGYMQNSATLFNGKSLNIHLVILDYNVELLHHASFSSTPVFNKISHLSLVYFTPISGTLIVIKDKVFVAEFRRSPIVILGDPVWPWAICTAVAQDKSGLTTCTVMETRCHYWNVDTMAGVFITVVTAKTCQLPVVTLHVSRAGLWAYISAALCRLFAKTIFV